MFFYLSQIMMFILSFCNRCWMLLKSKPMLWRREIMTQMLLFRSPNSILILSRFNLHNLKYLTCVSSQTFVIKILLFIAQICHLQGKGQFLFLPMRNSSLTRHQIFHCQNIQRLWLVIFPPFHLCLYRQNVLDIIALFFTTLRMKL